ncbi:hypothetical protein TNCT_597221 [Trichonephila clavata]|uniref:Uncharacterized protein n=1 Tax=Trichonephila clavata TaxID=2740835 RepID=A0A8X6HEZ2_TRICU|nr:hypothetical protein TNCT_597221 [Trichonephila clavata]
MYDAYFTSEKRKCWILVPQGLKPRWKAKCFHTIQGRPGSGCPRVITAHDNHYMYLQTQRSDEFNQSTFFAYCDTFKNNDILTNCLQTAA